MAFIFIGREFAEKTRECVTRGKGAWESTAYELRKKAEECMTKGPWSVTYYPSPVFSGDPHDYYSEAPYWWPDPKDPQGPYLRRDGEHRPDRYVKHHQALGVLSQNMLNLCNAGYYLDDRKYLDRAAELLRVWFIDPDTRMNPHLEFGEAIRNVCTGRSAGIIVLRQLDRIVHSMAFLEEYPDWQEELSEFKKWLGEMLKWLTTSVIGIAESKAGNNHAAWWTTHVAAYAAFTGNDEKVEFAFEHFRNVIIQNQVMSDGSLPRELARTRSFHYSLFNLDACSMLCELAYHRGVDLWNYKTEDGRGLGQAIRFMLPFLFNPYQWKYQEIDGEIPGEQYSLQMASVRLNIPECLDINEKRRGDSYLIRNQDPLGPLVLLPGYRF